MSFFFNKHPVISYDIGGARTVRNLFARYKLRDVLRTRSALYYTHDLSDGQSLEYIADRYYGDPTLDWVLLVVNDILDPAYDLPLSYSVFLSYIKSKYGSVDSAMTTIHSYEQILRVQSVQYDGVVLPERYITVDATTYATLAANDRRTLTQYEYEERLNESRRTIKVLDIAYLSRFLSEATGLFA